MSENTQGYIGFPVEGSQNTPFWSIDGLWQSSAALPVVMVPLTQLTHVLDEQQPWFEKNTPTLRELAEQARRIYSADLAYPIILSAEGVLMDGKHRLAKAFLHNHKEIAAVQFVQNPAPDFWRPEPNGESL